MGKLDNTPSWSESRVKTLRECRRKYWYNYYLAWEGWLRNVSQEKQQAYMLKKMTSLPMWAGSIVHEVIEGYLAAMHSRKGQGVIPLAVLHENATQLLRKGWLDSVNKRWQGNGKAVNLSEHYYEQGIPQEQCDRYKLKVLRCITAFYKSGILAKMTEAGVDKWLTMEEFQSFTLNTGEIVVVKLDAAFKFGGKVYLIDWKTGRPTDAVVEQLTTYAMYALKMGWAKKPSEIVLVPVFLDADEGVAQELPVTMADLDRQANIIRKEFPMLVESHEVSGDPARFAVTDDENRCKWCFFRKICSGPKAIVEEGVTPF